MYIASYATRRFLATKSIDMAGSLPPISLLRSRCPRPPLRRWRVARFGRPTRPPRFRLGAGGGEGCRRGRKLARVGIAPAVHDARGADVGVALDLVARAGAIVERKPADGDHLGRRLAGSGGELTQLDD